jgi:hypothetical protein
MRAGVLLVAGGVAAALVSQAGPAQAAAASGGSAGQHTQAAITTAKAKKLAKAGALTTKDLPGFDAAPQPADPKDAANERAVYKCLGAKVPTYAARNLGTAFTSGPLEVDSSADVISTVAAAKADLKAFTSDRAADCFKKALTRSFRQQGAVVSSVAVTPISVKVSGADAVIAYRYTAKATVQGQQLKLVGHELDILVGQTEISISPGVYNAPAPSVSTTVGLAKRLAKRVRAV